MLRFLSVSSAFLLILFSAGCTTTAALKHDGYRSAVVAAIDRPTAEKALRQYFEENYDAILLEEPASPAPHVQFGLIGQQQHHGGPHASAPFDGVVGVRRHDDGIRRPGQADPAPLFSPDEDHVFTSHTSSLLRRRIKGGEEAAEALVENVPGGVRLHVRVFRMGQMSGTKSLGTPLGTASQSERNVGESEALLQRITALLAAKRAEADARREAAP